jgi:hypothetical protein
VDHAKDRKRLNNRNRSYEPWKMKKINQDEQQLWPHKKKIWFKKKTHLMAMKKKNRLRGIKIQDHEIEIIELGRA